MNITEKEWEVVGAGYDVSVFQKDDPGRLSVLARIDPNMQLSNAQRLEIGNLIAAAPRIVQILKEHDGITRQLPEDDGDDEVLIGFNPQDLRELQEILRNL